MTDETQVTDTPDAELATPQDQTSAQTTSTEAAPDTAVTTAPAYVTKEELDQIMAETLRRSKQSDRDRMKQIDTKLDAIKTRLQADGGQLTQRQVSALREQITEEVEASADPASAPASAMTPEMQKQADYVYSNLDATFADVGATVTPNDPEWKEIKAVLDDPKGNLPRLIRVAGKAAEKKMERHASQKTSAAARAVGGGGSSDNNNISSITDAAELYKLGERMLREKNK